MVRRRTGWIALIAGGLSLALTAGCGSFGPSALERTHGRYNESVHEVEEEEFLLNLVRTRYNDTPSSLNVTSIDAQYELAGQAEARPFFVAPNPSNSNVVFKTFTSILPDLLVSGANRPTLSLTPGDDGTSVRQFLTPISNDTLLFLAQCGWPVSTILRLWVERLNGVPNASTASNPVRNVLPDFARFQQVADLLQLAQDQELGSIVAEERFTEVGSPLPEAAVTAAASVEAARNGLQFRQREDKTWALSRRDRRLSLEVAPGAEKNPEMRELESLLNLQPGQRRYEIIPTEGGVPDPGRWPSEPSAQLRLMPRSTAQVYFYMANGIEVPPEHIECGLVPTIVDADGTVFDTRAITQGLFEVHACKGHKPPPCASVAVCYRGYWFYIDDRDQASKAAFGLVLQLSRLDFKRQQLGSSHVLTLPVGR